MRNIYRCTLIAGAINTHAGPCIRVIAKIEEVLHDPGPNIGPANPQSPGTQFHHDAKYFRTIARARALNAKGNPRYMSVVRKVKDLIGGAFAVIVARAPWLFRGDCGLDDGDFRAVTHASRHLSIDPSICCRGGGSRQDSKRWLYDWTELAPLSLCRSFS
jgi:hypothetical protein